MIVLFPRFRRKKTRIWYINPRKRKTAPFESDNFTQVLLLLIHCWLLLSLWKYVIFLCFVVRSFVSILVLQSSRWERESWLLCFVCLSGVSRLLCGSFSRCNGFVCSLWLWYFLIILTYYFFPRRVAQSVTCLATDASLTADPGVASSIPARSHTFVEIDHEIISTVILLPSAESFKKGCCQLQAKVCARSTG